MHCSTALGGRFPPIKSTAFQCFLPGTIPPHWVGVSFHCSPHWYLFAQDSIMDESFATPENTPVAATSAREEATARPRNSIPLILVHPSSPTSITSPPNPELWWKLRKRTHDMLIPKRPVGKPPGVLQCLRSIICASCRWFKTRHSSSLNMCLLGLNILLICIPVSVRSRCPCRTLRWTNSRRISGLFTGPRQVQILVISPSLYVSPKTFRSTWRKAYHVWLTSLNFFHNSFG